mmetsp:Transcript_21532/g.50646  ORF Transcript_21532/g.50646 Transcript_21532/m.50646 type:complete len:373 (+) Transcript_21532:255-1373(+)
MASRGALLVTDLGGLTHPLMFLKMVARVSLGITLTIWFRYGRQHVLVIVNEVVRLWFTGAAEIEVGTTGLELVLLLPRTSASEGDASLLSLLCHLQALPVAGEALQDARSVLLCGIRSVCGVVCPKGVLEPGGNLGLHYVVDGVVGHLHPQHARDARQVDLEKVAQPAVGGHVEDRDELHHGGVREALALEAERGVQSPEEVGELRNGQSLVGSVVEVHPGRDEGQQVVLGHDLVAVLDGVLERVEDERHEEIEENERAKELEGHKEGDSGHRVAAAVSEVVVVLARHPRVVLHAVVHDAVPTLAGDGAEKQRHGGAEVAEVGLTCHPAVGVLVEPHVVEEVDAHGGVDDEKQQQQGADVDERGEGVQERLH